jgi:predicted nucleotide-binding protein (sugar kinase/HSP70/actin superfamily)
LTLGSLLKYLQEGSRKEELLLYFMPTASGPCRFGQYSYFIRHMIEQLGIEDVTLFSLQAENGYRDLGGRTFSLKLWSGVIISDMFQDIYSLILANAVNRQDAVRRFREEWWKVIGAIEKSPDFGKLKTAIKEAVGNLQKIEPIEPWRDVPTVLLTGEIFVRHDDLSRQSIVEKLADSGFAAKTSGVMEWIYYTDYCYNNNLAGCRPFFQERAALLLKSMGMRRYEAAFKKIVAEAGFMSSRRENVGRMIKNVRGLLSPQLTGEAILTVGSAINEVPRHHCGVMAIGPFGCMPNRLSEAILSREMGKGWQLSAARRRGVAKSVVENMSELPFLAIESDGNPFPQVITAKLEVFLAQAARLHEARRGEN